MENISPKLQNMISQYQELAQRIQTFATQRYAFEVQSKELEKAIQELEKSKEDAMIYRSAGNLLIQSKDKNALMTELKEQKETTDVRVKTLERQDKHLRERHSNLQEQITQALQGPGAAAPPKPNASGE